MKTIVVLPAYNAEKTLEKTISEIPMEAVNEIILVDDASSDRTFEIAKNLRAGGLPITAKKHSRNSGYGANQKTCYRLAMDRGAEIVVMLHPDYQYDPKLIRYFVEFISKGYFDVMLGGGYGREKNASKAACQGINIIPTASFPYRKHRHGEKSLRMAHWDARLQNRGTREYSFRNILR
jgi:glycosyltransferase involved in cell wall biosynthesis